MRTRLDWWRLQARDLLELVLVPGLAAVLPWPLCFKIFQRLVRWDWFYREVATAALHQARERGWVPADASAQREWGRARRLVTMIDHADFYLARSRSRRWMQRHLQVRGTWPEAGRAGVLCTFHWGAGMWALRHAAAHGMQAHMLVATLQGAHFAGRPVMHAYAKARTAQIARELHQPTIDTAASLRPVLDALAEQRQIMAVVDVPADAVDGSTQVELLNDRASVPKGLLRLVVQKKLPLTLFITGIDLKTGERFIHFKPMGVPTDLQALSQEVFTWLDGYIREQPPAWHFWSEAPRFFRG